MVKTITRIIVTISLVCLAWAHVYDHILTIVQREYLEALDKTRPI